MTKLFSTRKEKLLDVLEPILGRQECELRSQGKEVCKERIQLAKSTLSKGCNSSQKMNVEDLMTKFSPNLKHLKNDKRCKLATIILERLRLYKVDKERI